MSEKNDMNVHLSLGPSYNESVLFREKMKNLVNVCGILISFVSAAGWIYLFRVKEESYRLLRLDVLIVAGIVLICSLISIFFVGYDDRLRRNIIITMAIETVLSVVAFYWSKVGLLARPEGADASAMFHFLQFFIYLLCAVVLTFLPAVATSLLAWLIMKLFGRAA